MPSCGRISPPMCCRSRRSTRRCCSPASRWSSVVAGVGTAWIVTAYEFPGRSVLHLAAAAAARVSDLHRRLRLCRPARRLGPVQTALRAMFGWTSAADYWFPNIRSLGGAIFVMGFVLYPYVYLAARAMFQTQSAALIETARVLGAAPMAARARHHAAAGAAGDRGGRRARAARNAQRHRRQRISRRADADAVDLHHLAQPLEPAGRGADRLLHAARGRRPDRARALRPAAAGASPASTRGPAARSASCSRARSDGSRLARLSRSGLPRLPRAAASPRARGGRARPADRLRSQLSSATPSSTVLLAACATALDLGPRLRRGLRACG